MAENTGQRKKLKQINEEIVGVKHKLQALKLQRKKIKEDIKARKEAMEGPAAGS